MAAGEGERSICLIVMGPSGVGKTTTAKGLAKRLDWRFAEADEFHPPQNIEKMTHGVALSDEDRAPWLAALRDWISDQSRQGRSVVIACSALRKLYRDILREALAQVRFVELVASQEDVGRRLSSRTGHYMPPSLLPSQYATLESLQADEDGVRVEVDGPPEEVVDTALQRLGLSAFLSGNPR